MEELIRPLLPSGWTVTSSDSRVVVAREADVWMADSFSRPTMSAKEADAFVAKKGKKRRYQIVLRIEAPLSPAQAAERRAQNEPIHLLIRQLRSRMHHIRQRAGAYVPLGPAEQRLVDELEALQRKLIPLPDGLWAGRSVFLSSTQCYPETIHPAGVQEECAKVYEAVESLLTKY
jgi:alkanesulfonate monooxygenase SsuD/methylene tetrahydromethanopterin reductase-like flavin-dependent oxidoreductase (luciferase family)